MGKFNKGASTNLYYIVSDCIVSGIAFLIVACGAGGFKDAFYKGYVVLFLAFMVIYILSGKEAGLYNITTFFYADRFFKRVSLSYLIATSVTSTILMFDGSLSLNERFYIYFLVICYMLLIADAYLFRYWQKSRSKGAHRTLLVGEVESYSKFLHFMEKSNCVFNLIGYVSFQDGDLEGYLGSVNELERIIHENAIDQIYIMKRQKEEMIDVQLYLDMCIEMGVTARVIMNSYESGRAQSYVSAIGTYPVVTYHTVSLNATSRALKRCVDLLGAIVGIVIFSPIMLMTAVAIKWESDGPILFKQERVGLNGRRFYIYKFRSMCNEADAMKKTLLNQNEVVDGLMFKMKNDPRVTKVGKVIRKTSIDELPQFFNVLIGNMSLVGTRPPTVDEVEQYERNHWRRISIKPGITGLWQVSGRSTITDFGEVVELDTQYIDKWNVFMDFKIMIQTVVMLFGNKGAF